MRNASGSLPCAGDQPHNIFSAELTDARANYNRMTVHLVTFASDDYSRAAALCQSSALMNGVDCVFKYSPHDVWRLPYYEDHKRIFDAPRGCGYWAWKPALIDHLLQGSFIRNGDTLIYADAGVQFIGNVSHIIERMDQDIFLFGNEWQHAHWCKRDIVSAVWPSGPWGLLSPWQPQFFGKQVQASVIFFRVNDKTRAFVKEWLDWCLFEGGRLVDDSPSITPNHPEFRENRYDQAILTTLAYRDGIKLHGWFVRYETYEPARAHYPADDYPTLFLHHRLRDSEWGEHLVA